MTLQETCSEGGPVLAIPAELAAQWGGSNNGDYERACQPDALTSLDYGAIGRVSVGSGWALALDMELMTAFLPTPEGGVILRNYEDDPLAEETARTIIASVETWTPWGEPLPLEDGRLFVFDSAAPGAAELEDIEAEEEAFAAALGAGRYALHTAVADGIELIRFTRC